MNSRIKCGVCGKEVSSWRCVPWYSEVAMCLECAEKVDPIPPSEYVPEDEEE